MFNLAIMYSSGDDIPTDHGEAAKWLRKAATGGDPLARYELAIAYAEGLGVSQNDTEATHWLKLASDGQQVPCQRPPDSPDSIKLYKEKPKDPYNLDKMGWHYATGKYVAQDDNEAVRLFRKAARESDDSFPVSCNLAYMLAVGRGSEKNEIEAFRLFNLATRWPSINIGAHLNIGARLNLALMHAFGRGTLRNDAESARFLQSLRMSSGLYRTFAWHLISPAYSSEPISSIGHGLRQNLDEALVGYMKAASEGNAETQCSLAHMYMNGVGLDEDPAEARKWASAAAELGVARCKFLLGSIYESGRGVVENPSQAFSWYRKAAEQGDVKAQVALAAAYNAGRGVKKDLVQSYKWLLIAESRMDLYERIENRQYDTFTIYFGITPKQVEEARRLAQEWKPNSQGLTQPLSK